MSGYQLLELLLELPFDIFFVLFALFVGSFINLAMDRSPRGESLVTPRSHCRSCGRVLNVVDLLPVAGYFIRGGRCATCRTPIGISSPLIEATCGTFMLVSIVWLGVAGSVLGLILIAVFGSVAVEISRRRYRPVATTGR